MHIYLSLCDVSLRALSERHFAGNTRVLKP